MIEDEAIADHRDGQRAEHRAEHRAAAAEQARSAEHDRGDDVEFEAAAGVRRPASEPGGDDEFPPSPPASPLSA